jgi:hypothetical protein
MKTHKYKTQIYNIGNGVTKLQDQDNKQRRKMKLESSKDFDTNMS